MDFLLLPFLILILSSSLPSNADDYFINCGSSSSSTTPTNDGRTFAGDTRHPGVKLFAAGNTVSKNTGTQSQLYRTAMVFSSPSAYRFNIADNGTYLLRLHFSSSSPSSRFNVSASGHTLLPYFTPNPGSVVIEEFLLTVDSGEFTLYFIPASSSSATAFVSAIELFLTPLSTFSGSPVVVSPGIDRNLVSRVLRPIHRINFGGQKVPSSNDRLWRTWLPDDPYLHSNNTAKNAPIRISRPNYRGGNATDYDAPDAVYNTAKELNNFFNATWSFSVTRRSRYFVRVHFCDIISAALGATVFDLYISTRFSWKIDPFMIAPYLAAPFYLDFIVHSDDSGLFNVSVGPRNDTRITQNAFINGLEIMEILSTSAVEPQICAPGLTNKAVVPLIGFVACVVAFTYLLATYLKPNKQVIQVEAFPYWSFGNSETKLGQKTTSKLLG